MADYNSLSEKSLKYPRSSSSFFNTNNNFPRLFTAFSSSKGFSTDCTEHSVMMSPTSILDAKPFSAKTPKPETKLTHLSDPRGIGLGLVHVLTLADDDDHDYPHMIDDGGSDPNVPKRKRPGSRMVLFGSQLKIQIPPLPTSSVVSPVHSPESPGDFGIKTRNSVLLGCTYGSSNPNSPRVFSGCLSASEMELSEDYTRIISHGPNPKTTHIFDDCIVESCSLIGKGVNGSENKEIDPNVTNHKSMIYPSEKFLSFCKACSKNLGQGDEVYTCNRGGDDAFCKCCVKEIMDEEGICK